MEELGRGKAGMDSDFYTLIDSDAFVGRFFPDDPHHQRVQTTFQELEDRNASLVTTSLVVVETATVLSHKAGQALARTFLKIINRGNTPIIHIDETLQKVDLKLFERQTKKGTSVIDCVNVAVIRRFHIPRIFSFDKVYSKSFNLKVMG